MAKDKDKDESGDEAKPGGKKKLMIMVGAAVAVLGIVGYMFLGSSGDAKAEEKVEHVPGAVVTTDPIHINLADGHFLKLGMGLQVIEGPAHEPDPAAALDAAISLFSGREITDLQNAKYRGELKAKLVKSLDKLYHHEVYDVYFTEFVVQ